MPTAKILQKNSRIKYERYHSLRAIITITIRYGFSILNATDFSLILKILSIRQPAIRRLSRIPTDIKNSFVCRG